MSSSSAPTNNTLDDPTQKTVKKDMDKDAILALMTLASTSDTKGSDSTTEDKERASTNNVPPLPPLGKVPKLVDPVRNQSSLKHCVKPLNGGNRFPAKLMFILNNSDYNNILSWTTDGQAFVFHDTKAFETVVLPSTFKDSKFDSFLRKLYRWGFSKCQVYSKVACPAYRHEKFLRDLPDVAKQMECRSKPKFQPLENGNFHNMGIQNFAPMNNYFHHGSFDGYLHPQQQQQQQQHSMMAPSNHLHSSHNPPMSARVAADSHDHQYRQQNLMQNMCADVGKSSSLSEYISSRREHHQRIMNSAASVFQNDKKIMRDMDMMNMNMALNMGRMPNGMGPTAFLDTQNGAAFSQREMRLYMDNPNGRNHFINTDGPYGAGDPSFGQQHTPLSQTEMQNMMR